MGDTTYRWKRRLRPPLHCIIGMKTIIFSKPLSHYPWIIASMSLVSCHCASQPSSAFHNVILTTSPGLFIVSLSDLFCALCSSYLCHLPIVDTLRPCSQHPEIDIHVSNAGLLLRVLFFSTPRNRARVARFLQTNKWVKSLLYFLSRELPRFYPSGHSLTNDRV